MKARKWIFVGILFIGIFTLYSSLAPPANAITYYACKNNSDGTIKIVAEAATCKNNETKISWNQVGPEGPIGPQGLQGQMGSAGWTHRCGCSVVRRRPDP